MRRVLLVFANPRSTTHLRLGEEDRAVSEALQLAPLRITFELAKLHAATIDDLHRALLQNSPEIVHISGHGTDRGLLLETTHGEAAPVPPAALSELLALHTPPKGKLRCVILNACYSRSQGESLGVEATLAMEGPLTDEAAVEFARGFYDAVAAGHTYEEAFRSGRVRVRLKTSNPDWDACQFFQGQAAPPEPTLSRKQRSAGRWLLGGLAATALLSSSWWLASLAPNRVADVVKLRVLVLGPEGVPAGDARIWTSVGGEIKQVAGGWEVEIPLSKRPANGEVTVYAAREDAFLKGSQIFAWREASYGHLTVRLQPDRSQSVRGVVLDSAGNSLGGAQVSVVGYGEEAVMTPANGQFVLPAHAADGQTVQLRVEKNGYQTITQLHPAGNFPATLTLE